jgi:HEAT repeat protein
VRAAALDALGAVGTVQGLSAAPALAEDPAAPVRAACARALGWLGRRHRRADLARAALEGLSRDADPTVADAALHAFRLLEEP